MGNPNRRAQLPWDANAMNRQLNAARSRAAAARAMAATGAPSAPVQNHAAGNAAVQPGQPVNAQPINAQPINAQPINTQLNNALVMNAQTQHAAPQHAAPQPAAPQPAVSQQAAVQPAATQAAPTVSASTQTINNTSLPTWTRIPIGRMTSSQRRALSNLPYSQTFTLCRDWDDEAGDPQRDILGTCSPLVIAAFASKIRNMIADDPRRTSYEPRVRIGASSVQAMLDWAESQCVSGMVQISHIDLTPLYAYQIVDIVRLATEIGISYDVLGVREAAVQYCNHYGADAAYELWEKAGHRGCPALVGVLRPFCT